MRPAWQDDDLDRLVSALDPAFTERFGEICWAQGGVGFGWWPAFIYDPRQTVGSARELAKKHIGKRHLVYFFECHDAPFACLVDSKITKWEDGLMEDYHLGKGAKSSGKTRVQMFQHALQAATVEGGKPIECRMAFNHSDQPHIIPSHSELNPSPKIQVTQPKQAAVHDTHGTKTGETESWRHRGFPLCPTKSSKWQQVASRRSLKRSLESLYSSQDSSTEDASFCCKIFSQSGRSEGTTGIGFIRLPSRTKSSFADARKMIQRDLASEHDWLQRDWRFYIPTLGPVSKKQETGLGPMFPLLSQESPSGGVRLGPVRVTLIPRK